MSSSSPEPKVVAQHPEVAAAHMASIFSAFALNTVEEMAIRSIVSMTLPPPNIGILTEVVDILSKTGVLPENEAMAFKVFAQRNSENSTLSNASHQRCYPICYAIRRLYRSGRDFPDTRDTAIQILVARAQCRPKRAKFTGHMYYRHVLGFRDVFERYWLEVKDARRIGDHSRGDQLDDIVDFIDDQEESSLLTDSTRQKFRITRALLDVRLQLGGTWPRGRVENNRHRQIGSRVSVSKNVLAEITPIANVHSARVDEPYMDDEGISAQIRHADGATTRDKQKVTRFALSGFARTNVRTLADMNACSAVTYSDYLTHAAEKHTDLTYALVWLSAFPGIDVSRPIAVKKCENHAPVNDCLLVDPLTQLLEYNILRRRRRSDTTTYETAGTMRLPLPERVCSGLSQIVAEGTQCEIIVACNRQARVFSRTRPGLTPTLTRLKATSRLLLAPRQFSELEFCAVSGRVIPALKGISAYYPKNVVSIASKFVLAYEAGVEQLGLLVPDVDELPAPRPSGRDELFCKPSPGIDAVQELMDAICRAYVDSCVRVESLGSMVTPEDLIGPLRIHEAGGYVLQQIALGIRPIGDVADFVVASGAMGVMVRDKGSRLFAERSFSPLSDRHSKLLSCAQNNRFKLRQLLRFRGRRFRFEEPNSSLACDFRPDPDGIGIVAVRLTNEYFRYDAPVVSKIVDHNHEFNWLRHVATEYAAGMAAQWQLDEFFSHRRIGREAMSKWSTAGSSHFEAFRECIDDLVMKLVSDQFLAPVSTYALKNRNFAG